MDYVISKPSSIVTDKKGRIRFAGTDSETLQWAIDRASADQERWYNRVLRWIGFRRKSIIYVGSSLEITGDVNVPELASDMELRGSVEE